jgi:hypothetical protein
VRGGTQGYLWREGGTTPAGRVLVAVSREDPAFLSTIGARLMAGRGLAAGDPPDAVVIETAVADRFWPAGDALGSRFSIGTADAPERARERVVVGIVSSLRWLMATDVDESFVVLHEAGAEAAGTSFVVRLNAGASIAGVVSQVRRWAPAAVVTATPVADRYAEADGDARIAAVSTMTLGAVGALVAGAGIYGVLTVILSARTRELGIRLALGASGRQVGRALLLPTAIAVASGLAIGMLTAVWAGRLIENQILGVATSSASGHAVAIALIGACAAIASVRPLRRAVTLDPAIVLRAE